MPVTSIRRLDVATIIQNHITWLIDIFTKEEAPGIIVGISGTDSILTYCLCLEAFKRMGKPLSNVRGINFQHETQDKFVEMNAPFVCMESDDTKWVAREIFPWIKQFHPGARLEVDTSIPHSKDGHRWGAIHDKAKEEVNGRGDMLAGTYYFPVGTRNATEQAIGGYTLITNAVSLFPIIDIYKSEVIDICQYLGVPQIAIDKSKDIDCDCGRFEIQAYHMTELDEEIMVKQGLISRSVTVINDMLDSKDPKIRHDVKCFLSEEQVLNEFKNRVPYRP